MPMDWNNKADVMKRRQQAIDAGYKAKDVDAFIAKKRAQSATVELGQQGVVDVAEIAKTDPMTALQMVQKGVKPKASSDTKETATLRKEFTQQTKDTGFKEIQSSWNKVREAEESGAGDLTVVYSYIKALDPTTAVREGEINLTKAAESIPSNVLRAYQRAKEGKVISPELRQEMIGEIGRMYNEKAKQQKELNAFYSGLATDMGADPKDVVGAVGEIEFADVDSPEMGTQTKESDNQIKGILGTILGGGKAATDFLIPQTKNLPNKINELSASRMSRRDQKGDLLGVLKNAGIDTAEMLGAAAPIGAELAGVLGLAGIAKGGLSKLPGAGKAIKRGPGGYLADKRGEAVAEAVGQGVNMSGDEALQAGQEYLKDVPMAKETAEEIFPLLQGKNLGPQDVLDKLHKWGALTYSRGGDPKSNAAAGLMNSIYGNLRGQLSQKAPEVAKYQGMLHMIKDLPKEVSKKGWQALKFTALGKMLGL